MALKLTKEQRDKLEPADFADPDRRLFPVTDQDSADEVAKLAGKARNPERVRENLAVICKRKGLKIPDGVCAAMSVEFTLGTQKEEDGDHVIIPCPVVFRCGDYPDKNFSLTPEEAEAHTLASFAPVELDLEHKPTVLSGKLGQLKALFQDDKDPWLLAGKVRIPRWLDALLGPEERKLSAAFDRNTKACVGCGIVRNPRVSDAAMMAAFARAETEREERERLAREEEERQKQAQNSNPTPTPTPTQAPAPAAGTGSSPPSPTPTPAPAPASAPAQVPAPSSAAAPAPAADASFAQHLRETEERLRAEFSQRESTLKAEAEAARKRAEELATQNGQAAVQAKAEREGRWAAEAVNFADQAIMDRRYLSRQRDGLITAYITACKDDFISPEPVLFGGDKITRVEMLRRQAQQQEQHQLDRDMLPTAEGMQTLFNRTTTPAAQSDGPVSEQRTKELLAQTQLGRHAIARKDREKAGAA